MPTIITAGAAAARGYGLFGASRVIAPDTAIRFKASNTSTLGQQSSTTVSLLSGYSAGIYIYMVGDATFAGATCCGNCGRSASGEFAQYAYTCNGGETGLLVQFNISGNAIPNNILKVTIQGGANNGKACYVGSFNNACGNTYGNAAAPTSRVSSSDVVFSRITSGAYANGSGNYYTDDYFYTACGNSYGSGVDGYSADGNTRGNYGNCSNGNVGGVWLQYRNNY